MDIRPLNSTQLTKRATIYSLTNFKWPKARQIRSTTAQLFYCKILVLINSLTKIIDLQNRPYTLQISVWTQIGNDLRHSRTLHTTTWYNMYSQINNPTKSSSSKNIFDPRAFGFLGHEGPRRLWKKPAHARVALVSVSAEIRNTTLKSRMFWSSDPRLHFWPLTLPIKYSKQ